MMLLLLVAAFLITDSHADRDDSVALNAMPTSRMEKQQLLNICNRSRQQAGMSPVSWSPKLENQALELALTCPTPGTNIGQTQSSNVHVRTAGSFQAYPNGFQAIQKVGCAKADCSQQFGPEYGAGIVLVCIYDNVVDDIIATSQSSQPLFDQQSTSSSASYGTKTNHAAGSYIDSSAANRISQTSAHFAASGTFTNKQSSFAASGTFTNKPSSESSYISPSSGRSFSSDGGSSYISSTGSSARAGSSVMTPSSSSYIGNPLTSSSSMRPSRPISNPNDDCVSLPPTPAAPLTLNDDCDTTGGGSASQSLQSSSYMQQPSSSSTDSFNGQTSFDNSSSSRGMRISVSSQHEVLLDGIPVVTD